MKNMKAFQAILAFGFFQQMICSGVLHGEDGPVDLNTEEFCTDVSQYSDKYYEEGTEQCCTTMYIPNCEKKVKKVCMDVVNTICKPFVTSASDLAIEKNPGSGGPGDGNNDGDGTDGDDAANNTVRPGHGGDGNGDDGDGNNNNDGSKDGDDGKGGDGDNDGGNSGDDGKPTKAVLIDEFVDIFECKPVDVVLSHIKQVPECKPVTSLNCETGWKVVDGRKVWSGEEDCEEVTWQDCKLVEKEVPFHATESRCGPASPPRESFATCANKTVDVPVPVTRVSFVQGTTCKPEKKRECVDMVYEDCSKPIRMEACSEVEVRKPKQDFIHKKKCLLPSDIERLSGGRR